MQYITIQDWYINQYANEHFWEALEVEDFTQEEIEKINKNYFFDLETRTFTESPKSKENEKQALLFEYRTLQKEIIEVRAEIEDLQDNIKQLNITDPNKLALTEARIWVLEARRTEKRNRQDELVWEWVAKFWPDIINEI